MNNRYLISATVFDVTINSVVACVDLGIRKPFVQSFAFIRQRFYRGFVPVNGFCSVQPKGFGIILPACVDVFIGHFGCSFTYVAKELGRSWGAGQVSRGTAGPIDAVYLQYLRSCACRFLQSCVV